MLRLLDNVIVHTNRILVQNPISVFLVLTDLSPQLNQGEFSILEQLLLQLAFFQIVHHLFILQLKTPDQLFRLFNLLSLG
jgi:hypothetical protein